MQFTGPTELLLACLAVLLLCQCSQAVDAPARRHTLAEIMGGDPLVQTLEMDPAVPAAARHPPPRKRVATAELVDPGTLPAVVQQARQEVTSLSPNFQQRLQQEQQQAQPSAGLQSALQSPAQAATELRLAELEREAKEGVRIARLQAEREELLAKTRRMRKRRLARAGLLDDDDVDGGVGSLDDDASLGAGTHLPVLDQLLNAQAAEAHQRMSGDERQQRMRQQRRRRRRAEVRRRRAHMDEDDFGDENDGNFDADSNQQSLDNSPPARADDGKAAPAPADAPQLRQETAVVSGAPSELVAAAEEQEQSPSQQQQQSAQPAGYSLPLPDGGAMLQETEQQQRQALQQRSRERAAASERAGDGDSEDDGPTPIRSHSSPQTQTVQQQKPAQPPTEPAHVASEPVAHGASNALLEQQSHAQTQSQSQVHQPPGWSLPLPPGASPSTLFAQANAGPPVQYQPQQLAQVTTPSSFVSAAGQPLNLYPPTDPPPLAASQMPRPAAQTMFPRLQMQQNQQLIQQQLQLQQLAAAQQQQAQAQQAFPYAFQQQARAPFAQPLGFDPTVQAAGSNAFAVGSMLEVDSRERKP